MRCPLPSAVVTCALIALGCGELDAGAPAPAPVALFTRDWLLPIAPDEEPRAGEFGRALQLKATPGEYEPGSVGLYATVPLEKARLSVGDLAGPGGARLPSDAWEVRVTRYIDPATVDWFARWERPPGALVPSYLDAQAAFDLPRGGTRQFWLTLHVPDDAAPGVYRGEARLEADGRPAVTLPVEVEVYPFRLAEAGPAYFLAGDNWPLTMASFADSRAHGMNTLLVNHGHAKVAGVYRNGAWSFPGLVHNVEHVVGMAQRAGLGRERPIGIMLHSHLLRAAPAGLAAAGIANPAGHEELDDREDYWVFHEPGATVEAPERFRGPYRPVADPAGPPTSAYGRALYDGWVAAFRMLDAEGKRRGWPRLFYWLVDEPHVHRGRFRTALVMARAAREAGALSLVTCNEPTVHPDPKEPWFPPVGPEPALGFGDLLGIRCYNTAYLGPETRERARAEGAQYGTYVNVYGNEPAGVRLQTGLLAHRLRMDVVMIWAWQPLGTAPDQRGRRAPLRDWEAAREGIDDLRYVEALERALAAGRGTPAAREAARRVLAEVAAATPERLRGRGGIVDSFTGRRGRGAAALPPERFDALRRAVAAALVALDNPRPE